MTNAIETLYVQHNVRPWTRGLPGGGGGGVLHQIFGTRVQHKKKNEPNWIEAFVKMRGQII